MAGLAVFHFPWQQLCSFGGGWGPGCMDKVAWSDGDLLQRVELTLQPVWVVMCGSKWF